MTQATNVAALDRSIEVTNTWLGDFADELEVDRETAYRIMRGGLHTLRDNLTSDEALHLAAQLPTFIRGMFFTGWNPHAVPQSMELPEFLQMFKEQATLEAPGSPAPAAAARALIALLEGHVSAGEMDDVLGQLKTEVREHLTN